MRVVVVRVGRLLIVLFVASLVTFSLTSLLPGDQAINFLGVRATQENLDELRRELRLDDPFVVRYFHWVTDLLRGDFGASIRYPSESVGEVLARRFGVTALLVIYAQVIAVSGALLLTIQAARRPGGWFDRLQTRFLYGLLASPEFLVGSILILVFVSGLHLFPAIGFTPPGQDFLLHLRSMVLPALTLALPQLAVYGRLLRDDVGEVLKENFVLQARAKGIAPRRILSRHVLPPASFTLITVVGLGTAQMLGGAVIVESLFSLPGLGTLLVSAVGDRDYTMVQGAVIVMALAFAVMTLLTDVVYGLVDPRVRSAAKAA
jgi:peptide/nickel transport system permease protein